MKKAKKLLTVVLSAVMLVGLSGCQATAEPTLEAIELRYWAGNTYVIGETVQEDNNKLKLTYSDNSGKSIDMTDPAITITGNTSSVGQKTGIISYNDLETTFTYTVYAPTDDPVTVSGGQITGYVTEDGAVEVYKGIPYAAPPVGYNRWRAPKDVEPWEGVKPCVHFGPSGYQSIASSNPFVVDNWAGFSEDCLTLNVWTNGRDTADKPVLVFIHGGGYTTGGSSCPVYDGEVMARNGVVFVSINYRLGVYGFLSTEELAAENDGAGNFGMLDQVKALEWVRDNIAEFGGDKDNVTIMGQSAGGMSIQGLLVNPNASGLYARAFIDSGMIAWGYPSIEERNANCTTDGKTIDELRSMSIEEITKSVKMSGVGSCYDGINVLSPSSWEAYAKNDGNCQNIDLLVGSVTGDVDIFGTGSPEVNSLLCISCVQARIQGGATGAHYVFYDDYIQGGGKTRNHTDDVPFWFGNKVYSYGEDAWTAEDTARVELMNSYLINFCKTGNPNGEGLPVWEANEGMYNYLHLGTGVEMENISSDAIAQFEADYPEISHLVTR